MDNYEKTIKVDNIYEGKILSLRVETVEMPDKKYSKREIVDHMKGVGIIAFDGEDSIYLVRQYRKAVDEFTLEIPAGLVESNEKPIETAKRELQEETGAGDFRIEPICVYSVKGKTRVNENIDDETFGMLFIAGINSFEELHSEIEKILISDKLVENWTYPLIQPILIEEAKKRGFI